jgi:MFS family permease
LGLSTALSLMGDTTLYTVLPANTQAAGIALTSVGVILSANRAVRLLFNGPAGYAYDRLPRRHIYVPALFIGALSTALYAWNGGFWPLLVGRVLWGLAWSGIWVGGSTIILDISNDRDRGRWSGLYQLWFFLGAGGGAFLGGLLTDWLGYHSCMAINASISLIGALVALLLLPETRPTVHQPASTASQAGIWHISETLARWRTLGANRGFLIATAIQGINRFTIAGVLAATLALLVAQNLEGWGLALGVGTLTGALMFSRTLFSMIAAPLSGSLSDARGDRWMVTAGLSLSGGLGMLLATGGHPLVMLVGILLTAIASSGMQTMTTALTGDLVDIRQRGQSIGWLNTAGDLGSALGPLLAYAWIPLVGLLNVYLFCAVLFTIGALLAYLAKGFQSGNAL